MNHKRLQPAEAQRLLRALFIGAEIATFEYWADFIVRLERNLPRDQQEIEHELIGGVPSVLWLRLEADWWVGDRQRWEDAQASFPVQELRHLSSRNGPMKAAAIAQMLGAKITEIAVSSDGTLAIETSDKTTLSVTGVSDSPEHSWSIERRDDEFHLTDLVVICEPDGNLFGHLHESSAL
jgi:hypothetical protein